MRFEGLRVALVRVCMQVWYRNGGIGIVGMVRDKGGTGTM